MVEPTPFEKYARQNGNLPQVGMKSPKIFELPPPSGGFLLGGATGK